jgi:transposase
MCLAEDDESNWCLVCAGSTVALPPASARCSTLRLPTLVEPWARMTIRLCQVLQAIGLATSGKGGARLAARLGMPTSRQTILRRIMDLPPITPPPVRDLGIDEFAFRSGGWFGTILVDLERHRIIDLFAVKRDYFCIQNSTSLEQGAACPKRILG